MSEPRERRSLAEVFRKQMRDTDNDMPVAFIAVLHELDQRQRLVEHDLDENARLFNVMAESLDLVRKGQNDLPRHLRGVSETALNEALRSIKQHSHDGAESGARPATRAVEALERASEGYDDRKRWLTRLTLFGLPAAFCAAVVMGILFGNFAITALPAQWQWTCKVVGAEHWEPDNGGAYCIIRKD